MLSYNSQTNNKSRHGKSIEYLFYQNVCIDSVRWYYYLTNVQQGIIRNLYRTYKTNWNNIVLIFDIFNVS